MRVYRVERQDGTGPYRGKGCVGQSYLDHYDLERWPTPSSEGLPVDNWDRTGKHYYCGFVSLEQLKRWFRLTDREKLKKHEYMISVYESKSVKQGKKQACFKKKSARLVGRYCLVDIPDMLGFMDPRVAI